MNHVKRYLNDKGVTLVELLAAAAIVTIIILFFVSIFAQTTRLSDKTEHTLTSVNLAEDILNRVKANTADYTGGTKAINGQTYSVIAPVVLNGKHYYPYVSISPETPAVLKLNKVHVLIYAVNDYDPAEPSAPRAELFGYVETEASEWNGH